MISYKKVKASDLIPVVEIIQNALKGQGEDIAIMACIIAAINYQDPNLDGPKLISTSKTISEYMALALGANYPDNGTVN